MKNMIYLLTAVVFFTLSLKTPAQQTGTYPVTYKFNHIYKPGATASYVFYLNENKVEFFFSNNSNEEYTFKLNYKPINLKSYVAHGADSDCINAFLYGMNKIDYTDLEIIKDKNIHLVITLIKTNPDKSKSFEIQLTINSKPSDLRQMEAKYLRGVNAESGIWAVFQDKKTNKEFSFPLNNGDMQFVAVNEDLLKNNFAIINFADGGEAYKITGIRVNNLSLNSWWDEACGDNAKLDKYEKITNEYWQKVVSN